MRPLRSLKAFWIVSVIAVLVFDAAAFGCPIIAADRRSEESQRYGRSLDDRNHRLSPTLRPGRRVRTIVGEREHFFTNKLRGESDAGARVAGATTSTVPAPGSFLLLVCGGMVCSGGYFRRLVRRQT